MDFNELSINILLYLFYNLMLKLILSMIQAALYAKNYQRIKFFLEVKQ